VVKTLVFHGFYGGEAYKVKTTINVWHYCLDLIPSMKTQILKENNMKFLTINRMKDSLMLMPPTALTTLFEASIAAMKQQMKEGHILEMYFSPGEGVIVGIHNYDDADQWAADIIKIPLLMYADYKAYPLADYDKYLNNSFQAMKAIVKSMAPSPK
jgi:hypothetical protein